MKPRLAVVVAVSVLAGTSYAQTPAATQPLIKPIVPWTLRGGTPFQIFQAKGAPATALLTVCVAASPSATAVEVKNGAIDNFFVLDAARPCSSATYTFAADGRAWLRLVTTARDGTVIDAKPSARAAGAYSVNLVASPPPPPPVVSWTVAPNAPDPNAPTGQFTKNDSPFIAWPAICPAGMVAVGITPFNWPGVGNSSQAFQVLCSPLNVTRP